MYARHDLVWLSAEGWQHALDTAPSIWRDAIAHWRRANLPAIVRREEADMPPDLLSVGIALPPRPTDGRKIRIGLQIPRSEVEHVTPPLSFSQITQAAPPPWRSSLTMLDQNASLQGLTLRVYGSLALQALTGKAYVTAASDIDVLSRPTTEPMLYDVLDLLQRYACSLPLDGEIVFPTGQAVAWKEFLHALTLKNSPRVLVKEMRTVRLATIDELLDTIRE